MNYKSDNLNDKMPSRTGKKSSRKWKIICRAQIKPKAVASAPCDDKKGRTFTCVLPTCLLGCARLEIIDKTEGEWREGSDLNHKDMIY